MAIQTYSNFSPNNSSLHKLTSNSAKFFAFSTPFHQILSFSCINPKSKNTLHSSASVLDVELSNNSKTSPNPEFEPREPNEETNVNKVLVELLKDPSTQELGLEYYEKAKANPGFVLESGALKNLLRYLVKTKIWDLIFVVCDDILVYKCLLDSVFCGNIVSSCIKARKFKVANALLDCYEKVDKKVACFAYVNAIRSYNKLHMYGVSVDLYRKMKSNDVVLDSRGYVLVMESYLKLGSFDEVFELFSELESSKKLENLENVVQVYEVLMEGLRKSRLGFKALEEFERLREKGISSSPSIYASLIGSLIEMKEINVVECLVEEAESKLMIKDSGLFLKLVVMYVEQGLIEKTVDVVKIMKGANLKVSDCIFCAIVNGFAKKRGLKESAIVYEELVLDGCQPGQVTYTSIINVYFRLGLFSKARNIFDQMQQRGFDKCVVAYSTMIVMYGKTGQLREAMKLLAKMKEKGCEPNVWVYNALIDVHGRSNELRQVDKIWKEMKRKKIKPDRVSYTSIIGAYSRAREYEACTEFYEEYRMNGGKIELAMAGIMVSVYSKINRIDELVKLLQSLKAEGIRLDARLYRSSLNAMRDAGLQMQTRWLQESFGASMSESLVEHDVRPYKRPGLR